MTISRASHSEPEPPSLVKLDDSLTPHSARLTFEVVPRASYTEYERHLRPARVDGRAEGGDWRWTPLPSISGPAFTIRRPNPADRHGIWPDDIGAR